MFRSALWSVFIIAFTATCGQGDVTISKKVSISTMNVSTGDIREVDYIKGECLRNECEMPYELAMLSPPYEREQRKTTIKCLDHGIKWILNPDDSSYIEEPLNDPMDTLPFLVDDQQSLDSILLKQADTLVWQFDTLTVEKTDYLGYDCTTITSFAVMYGTDSTQVLYLECTLWLMAEADYVPDAVLYDNKTAHIAGLSKYPHLAPYDAVLSQFSASLEKLHLDTVFGIPVKVDISFQVNVTQHMTADFDARIAAEQVVAEEILDDETKALEADSDLTGIETAYIEMDSMIAVYENLFAQMQTEFLPGRLEFFGFIYEITSIDTTALPDSLFEIPLYYRKL